MSTNASWRELPEKIAHKSYTPDFTTRFKSQANDQGNAHSVRQANFKYLLYLLLVRWHSRKIFRCFAKRKVLNPIRTEIRLSCFEPAFLCPTILYVMREKQWILYWTLIPCLTLAVKGGTNAGEWPHVKPSLRNSIAYVQLKSMTVI